MQTFQAFFAERTLAFAALRHPHGPARPGQDLSRELIEHVLAHAHDIVPRRQALHYHDLPQTSKDGPLILLSGPTPSVLRVRVWLGAKLLLTQAVPAITDRRSSWMCLLASAAFKDAACLCAARSCAGTPRRSSSFGSAKSTQPR